MRRSRVAIGSERPIAASRTPASSCCGASARSPPMTIAPGLKKLMHSASTSPTARPASRTACSATRLARARVRDDVADRARRQPGRGQVRRQRVAARDRLQAAGVAARAERRRRGRRAGCGRCRPPRRARPRCTARPDDDPALDARADVDVEQVVDLAPVRPVLAERHHVDVAVDQHGRRRSAWRTSPGSRSRPSRASSARRRARRGRTRPAPARRRRYRAHARARARCSQQLAESRVDLAQGSSPAAA